MNLDTGQATGVVSTTSTGVVTNFQNVFGGTGNDYLTSSAASNVMDGGAGDDTISGLNGNNIMVGNYGADNTNGGAGIDILIGDYVDFIVGSLQDRLESIMSSRSNVTDGTYNFLAIPSQRHHPLISGLWAIRIWSEHICCKRFSTIKPGRTVRECKVKGILKL
jgi:Ca2+-binding RTX toxin-like protein